MQTICFWPFQNTFPTAKFCRGSVYAACRDRSFLHSVLEKSIGTFFPFISIYLRPPNADSFSVFAVKTSSAATLSGHVLTPLGMWSPLRRRPHRAGEVTTAIAASAGGRTNHWPQLYVWHFETEVELGEGAVSYFIYCRTCGLQIVIVP